MTSREDDLDRLSDTRFVLGEGSHAFRQSVYAVYVAVLLALSYGFTVAQALFHTSDPAGLRAEILSWPALGALLVVGVTGTGLTYRAGRVRGPLVPPLPWTDLVATSAIDRALSLRRWLALALIGTVSGGVILGGVVGGGLWYAHVVGPGSFGAFLAVGLAMSLALLAAWLAGQAGQSPPVPGAAAGRPGPRTALRRLAVEDLRRQAVRSTRLGGAVLAGDVRAVRLEVAAPVSRGRELRLRSAGPVLVVARRDLLGLRRMPGGFATGTALVAIGGGAIGWSVGGRDVPGVFPALAMLACYAGFGAWAEGLRLHGDNVGTPPLLGIDTGTEAAAHTIVPVALFLAVGGLAAAVASAAVSGTPGPAVRAALWTVPLALILGGCHLLAAFRGLPPRMFSGFRSPAGLAAWVAYPALLAMAVGGPLTAAVASGGALAWPLGVGLGALLAYAGMSRATVLAASHRI